MRASGCESDRWEKTSRCEGKDPLPEGQQSWRQRIRDIAEESKADSMGSQSHCLENSPDRWSWFRVMAGSSLSLLPTSKGIGSFTIKVLWSKCHREKGSV